MTTMIKAYLVIVDTFNLLFDLWFPTGVTTPDVGRQG